MVKSMNDQSIIPKGLESNYDLDFQKLLAHLKSLPDGKYKAEFVVIGPKETAWDPLELTGTIGYSINGQRRIVCLYHSGEVNG